MELNSEKLYINEMLCKKFKCEFLRRRNYQHNLNGKSKPWRYVCIKEKCCSGFQNYKEMYCKLPKTCKYRAVYLVQVDHFYPMPNDCECYTIRKLKSAKEWEEYDPFDSGTVTVSSTGYYGNLG